MEKSAATVPIVINGLIKKPLTAPLELTTTYEERFELPKDAHLEDLWKKLDGLGYLQPTFVTDRKGSRWTERQMKSFFQPYEEVEVVADGTSVGANQIRLNESLVAFTNRGANLAFDLESDSTLSFNEAPVRAQNNELVVDKSLKIRFHRTIRMPDDGKMHQLPGSLGLFPLYNAGAYLSRVPDTIRESGGIFMPIWSREAVWMSFHSKSRKYALRVYAGRVNAVTGKTMDEEKMFKHSLNSKQDYVVVPGQRWLDGIHVQDGVVRQFVAMPLGSRYTVEGQKTGEEKYGGLQIEVIPEYQKGLRKWLPDNLTPAFMRDILDGIAYHDLSEMSTPSELYLQPGEKIRSYPPSLTFEKPVEIADLIDTNEAEVNLTVTTTNQFSSLGHCSYPSFDYRMHPGYPNASLRSSSMGLAAGGKLIQDIYRDHNPPLIWNTAASRIMNIHLLDPATCESITHIVPPPPPMDTKRYINSSLPFFVVEEQIDNRLEGGDFDNVKSVSTLDQEKGIGNESIFDPNKPTRCSECKIRLCDCIVRPCNHTFCNSCIKRLEKEDESNKGWQCPKCQTDVSHVAGFAAPMNLPGEESLKVNVPVSVLKVEDGRVAFRSIHTTRI